MNQPVEDNTQLLSNRTRPPNQSCYGFLSYETRITLFSLCLLIGIVVQCVAIWILYQSFDNSYKFALFFGIGMAVHLFGTTFIVSVKKQLLTVGNKQRFPALVLYTLMAGMVFLTGYYSRRPELPFGFMILEVCSYIWYCFCWSKYSKNFVDFMNQPEEEHHHNLELTIKGR